MTNQERAQARADRAKKVTLFRQTAFDQQARIDFAASRAEVILPLLDEQSTVRDIFEVEVLEPGAEARYDIPFEDIEAVWTMPQIGGIPVVQVEGSEMHLDTFGLDGGVEYQMDVAKDGRFQVAERSTRLLLNSFLRQEELAGWGLIKNHAAVLPSTQVCTALADVSGGEAVLGITTLNEVITKADEIGIGGRRVTDIYCSPRRFADLRTIVTTTSLPESLREQLWSNGQGTSDPAGIRIHRVYNSNLVAANRAYAFTQKQGFRYGVMPIRDELTTMDNPLSIMGWKHGIIGRERAGFGVIDDKGLIEIQWN